MRTGICSWSIINLNMPLFFNPRFIYIVRLSFEALVGVLVCGQDGLFRKFWSDLYWWLLVGCNSALNLIILSFFIYLFDFSLGLFVQDCKKNTSKCREPCGFSGNPLWVMKNARIVRKMIPTRIKVNPKP